jgi:hypothetical protein
MAQPKSQKAPPRERIFNGQVFELWSGEYGPGTNGHTKTEAQKLADEIRNYGDHARVVPIGTRYFIYFW